MDINCVASVALERLRCKITQTQRVNAKQSYTFSIRFEICAATRDDAGILLLVFCVRAHFHFHSSRSFRTTASSSLPLFGSLMAKLCALFCCSMDGSRGQVSAPRLLSLATLYTFNINDNDLAMISIYLPPLFRTSKKENRWKAHQSRWMMCEHIFDVKEFSTIAPHRTIHLLYIV